ncbi:MAG: thiamine diphosphokinase [Oscillospiraceae bacterium]
MQKICSIICGAPCERLPLDEIKGTVIAADRGLDYCLRDGIVPDIVIGDFDSAECAPPEGAECIRFAPEKDFTDAYLAAETAAERGAVELRFFAALGGRLDHTFANFQMAYGLHCRGISAYLFGENERAYLLSGRREVARFDGYLSVFAFGGSAVVSEEGTKYPAQRCELRESFPLGVSNEITDERAVITVHSGTALIIEHRRR